jgi:hypothetical protein
MKPVIFVAGPYTGGDGPEANVRAAIDIGQIVAKAGGVPFIPHLYHAWDAVHPADYEVWMDRCFTMVGKCNGLIRFGGESPGADRELRLAEMLGLHVLTLPDDDVVFNRSQIKSLVRLCEAKASEPVLRNYHPAVRHLLRTFAYKHLPEHLQAVSKPFHDLAVQIADRAETPEASAALRKLREAKDCAVLDVVLEGPDARD